MTTTPTMLFVCLHGSAKSLIALESPGPARKRWDDVPAVSEGYKPTRDIIVGRLAGLLDKLGRTA